MALVCVSAPDAHALDRKVRTMMVTGAYGAVAGTVLGLVSYPITGEPRGVFMGTSIGLYLGIVAGVFLILGERDPHNPLGLLPRLQLDDSGVYEDSTVVSAGAGGMGDLVPRAMRMFNLPSAGAKEGWTMIVRRHERELFRARHTFAASVRGPGLSLNYPVVRF